MAEQCECRVDHYCSKHHPNAACEHGHQRRKCPHCEIVVMEKEILRLEAARDRLREAVQAALMFIYDSEQGINGVEESANKTIDLLDAALTPPDGA